MSLESEIARVFSDDSVEKVFFEDGDTGRVTVMYKSRPFFKGWPYGDDAGSREEQEAYFQERFGVDWELVEIVVGTTRGSADSQLAVFDR